MEIVYVYTKKRKEFGRHTGHFADRAAKVEFDILPNPELTEQYMEKNPCVLEMHCIASISEHAANTNVTEFHERGMYHEEGGWPRDIDPTEPEHKIRFTCVAPPQTLFRPRPARATPGLPPRPHPAPPRRAIITPLPEPPLTSHPCFATAQQEGRER